jgi:hypothetical protein
MYLFYNFLLCILYIMYTVTVYTILVEIMLQLISLRIVSDTVDTELYLICILKRSKLKIPSVFQNHHKKKIK